MSAADDFTMMTWIEYAATTGSHAILWAYRTGRGTTPQVWLRAEPASNRIRALIMVDRFNVTVQSATAYNDGQWHHVVLQRAEGRCGCSSTGLRSLGGGAAGSVTAGKEFGVYGMHVGQRVDGADRFHGPRRGARLSAGVVGCRTAADPRDQQADPLAARAGSSLRPGGDQVGMPGRG